MIISFCGYAGSGKSTAAKYLKDNYSFRTINMKDALVEEMKRNLRHTLLSIGGLDPEKHSDEEIIANLFITKPPIMRALMQEYGTEVRRGDDPNYWVNKWATEAQLMKASGFNIVVDDVRFQNEFDKVKGLGGVIVMIKRSDINNAGTHQSEKELEQFVPDFTIEVGKGEHTALYKALDNVIETIKNNND